MVVYFTHCGLEFKSQICPNLDVVLIKISDDLS